MKTLLSLLAMTLLLGLAGCSTFESRAKERADTFAALSPEERQKLERGIIELGNSPDMVYIALGAPDRKRETTSATGRETIWTYNRYYQEYEGSHHTGYRRMVVYNPASKRYVVYVEPVFTDIYSDNVEENIRVVFLNDKVTQIDQPKSSR